MKLQIGRIGTQMRMRDTKAIVELRMPSTMRSGYVTFKTWLVLQENGQRAWVRESMLEEIK